MKNLIKLILIIVLLTGCQNSKFDYYVNDVNDCSTVFYPNQEVKLAIPTKTNVGDYILTVDMTTGELKDVLCETLEDKEFYLIVNDTYFLDKKEQFLIDMEQGVIFHKRNYNFHFNVFEKDGKFSLKPEEGFKQVSYKICM